MRTQGPVGATNDKTYIADSVITRGYFVAASDTDGHITAITGAGQQAIGLATSDGATEGAGTFVPVTRFGDGVAIAGAAIAFGQYLKVDAVGRVVPITGTAGDGEQIVGRAESSAAALGSEVVVFVLPSVN